MIWGYKFRLILKAKIAELLYLEHKWNECCCRFFFGVDPHFQKFFLNGWLYRFGQMCQEKFLLPWLFGEILALEKASSKCRTTRIAQGHSDWKCRWIREMEKKIAFRAGQLNNRIWTKINYIRHHTGRSYEFRQKFTLRLKEALEPTIHTLANWSLTQIESWLEFSPVPKLSHFNRPDSNTFMTWI